MTYFEQPKERRERKRREHAEQHEDALERARREWKVRVFRLVVFILSFCGFASKNFGMKSLCLWNKLNLCGFGWFWFWRFGFGFGGLVLVLVLVWFFVWFLV